jgi:hypothetical protein
VYNSKRVSHYLTKTTKRAESTDKKNPLSWDSTFPISCKVAGKGKQIQTIESLKEKIELFN